MGCLILLKFKGGEKMNKFFKKVTTVALGAALLTSGAAFAASGSNTFVGNGTVIYGALNKYNSTSAIGETKFVPLSGQNSIRSYVYIQARNTSNTIINKTEAYGKGYGTTSSPDNVSKVLTQPGTSKWDSTHRGEKTTQYLGLQISN